MKLSKAIALLVLAASVLAIPGQLNAQALWGYSNRFKFNVDSVQFSEATRVVKVVVSITDPSSNNQYYSLTDPKLANGNLTIDVGWTTLYLSSGVDLLNTGAPSQQRPPGAGDAAAFPIRISKNSFFPCVIPATTTTPAVNNCQGIVTNLTNDRHYYGTATIPLVAEGSGRAALEGRAAWPVTNPDGTVTYGQVPVKSVFKDFLISTGGIFRRQVVDINKCKVCHTGVERDGTTIPRLSLHGNQRTEEPGVCVICHNPNQTDIPYRTSGTEQSVDLKRMVHGIHAGGMRHEPLVIVGFQGSLNDFSGVRFPASLRDCLKCHITDPSNPSKYTFELPLKTNMGSTINTRSVYSTGTTQGYVDVDPSNDLKISPIAAVCSSCHDDPENLTHMVSRGASFSTTQAAIGKTVIERCPSCHGPGKEKDVRRMHLESDDD